MKKRFVTHSHWKRNLFRFFMLIFLIFISCVYTIKILFKYAINSADEQKVNEYLALSTNNLIGSIRFIDIINFNLAHPETILRLNFSNVGKLQYLASPVVKTNELASEPQVYIYNTHQSEAYNSESLKIYNITPTVYMASFMLKSALNKSNINAVVEESDIKKILTSNNWGYSQSYKASRIWLNNAKIKYPSVKYYIDIHRDSVSESITIDNIKYAKMMFVLGSNHSNYKQNESLMIKINDYLNDHYPGTMKSIRNAKKDVFNQDIDGNLILIEVGGNENNIDEVYNSINIFAEALTSVIGGI